MIQPPKHVREYLDAVEGYKYANESDFNVKLARYVLALEAENRELRKEGYGVEFDKRTGFTKEGA